MGRRGPKPRPAHLKVVEGNPGHERIAEPFRASPGVPVQPDWREYFADAASRKIAAAAWANVVEPLDRAGLLCTLDAFVCGDYAICVTRLAQLEREIGVAGTSRRGTRGTTAKSPLTTIANQYRSQLRWLAGELGLGPYSRSRLPAPGTPDDDDVAKIFD